MIELSCHLGSEEHLGRIEYGEDSLNVRESKVTELLLSLEDV